MDKATADREKKLLLISRLRAELVDLHHQGRLTAAEYGERSSELDRANFELVRGLETVALEELLDAASKAGLGVDLTRLRAELRGHDLKRVRVLRESALSWQRPFLDLDEVYPGIRRVPLVRFSWRDKLDAWEGLAAALVDPAQDAAQVGELCRAFFGNQARWSVPAGMPRLSRELVQRFLKLRLLSAAEADVLARDLQSLDNAYRGIARDFTTRALGTGELDPELYGGGSETAYAFLLDRANAYLDEGPLDLDRAIAEWTGAGWIALAAAWLQPKRGEGPARQHKKANLVYARTGVDPLDDAAGWRRTLNAEAEAETAAKRELLDRLARQRDLYELGLVLSAKAVLGQGLHERWWPLACKLRLPEPAPPPRPVVAPPPKPAPAAPPRPAAVEEEEVHDFLAPEDDAEHLVVAPARLSEEDLLVEEESAWNAYLKPFLSENWMGVTGVFSLLAAWMFFTFYFWEKVETYRILLGIVPLLTLTLGSAVVSRFIQRLEDSSAKAAAIFSSLAVYALPFNFALGASLLERRAVTPSLVALGLGAVYAVLAPWVGRQVASSFGHSPLVFLLPASLAVYLPPAAVAVLGEGALTGALAATLFLSFFVLTAGLVRAARHPEHFRFSWLTFATVFLLVNAIPHVYFRQPPSLLSLAVLLQLAAAVVTRFGGHRPTAIVTASGASVLGILLALGEPAGLAAVLALAAAFWFLERRHVAATWPDEVTALHLLGLAAAVAWALGVGPALLPLCLVPGVLAVLALEWRRSPTEVLTWGLPVWLVATVAAWSAGAPPVASVLAFVAGFLYGTWRSVRGRRVRFWSLHLFLGLAGGAWMLEVFDSRAELALYLGAVAALWALVAPLVRDALTREHRTLVLWLLAFAAAGVHAAAVFEARSVLAPVLAGGLGLALFALSLAAWRSRSSWPVYAALAVLVPAAHWLRLELGLGSGSGMGLAVGSLVLLGLAEVCERWHVGPRTGEAAKALGSDFPGRSDAFLVRPFEVAAVLAAVAGLARAFWGFAPLAVKPLPAIALAVAGAVLGRLAWRLRWDVLGWTVPIATAGVATAALLSLGVEVCGHATLALVTLLHPLRTWIERRSERFRDTVGAHFDASLVAVTWLFLPLSFAGYALAARGGPLALLSYAVVAMVYVHLFLVRPRVNPKPWAHGAILHVVVGWVAFVVSVADHRWLSFIEEEAWVLLLVAGAFALLFVPSFFFEEAKGALWRAYARAVQGWLVAVAHVAVLVTALALGLEVKNAAFPVTAWVLLHLANRRWQLLWMALLKGAACLAIVYLAFAHFSYDDALATAFLGMTLFAVLELLVTGLDRLTGGRLVTTPFPETPPPHPWAAAWTVVLMAAGVVTVHLVSFADLGRADHFWLYGLVPTVFLVVRRLGVSFLVYAGLGLFAYANSFYAVELGPRFLPGADLTALHFVSLAFVVSIAVYAVLGRTLGRGTP